MADLLQHGATKLRIPQVSNEPRISRIGRNLIDVDGSNPRTRRFGGTANGNADPPRTTSNQDSFASK
jgi:hypothetical protein